MPVNGAFYLCYATLDIRVSPRHQGEKPPRCTSILDHASARELETDEPPHDSGRRLRKAAMRSAVSNHSRVSRASSFRPTGVSV